MSGVSIGKGDRRIRFRRDVFGGRATWRYISDDEGQPFAWTTRVSDRDVSFVLPDVPCGLSVLVERDATKHPVWLDADSGGEHYVSDRAGDYSLGGELIRSKRARLASQSQRYRDLHFRPQQALDDRIGAALPDADRALEASERSEPRGAREARDAIRHGRRGPAVDVAARMGHAGSARVQGSGGPSLVPAAPDPHDGAPLRRPDPLLGGHERGARLGGRLPPLA